MPRSFTVSDRGRGLPELQYLNVIRAPGRMNEIAVHLMTMIDKQFT